MSESCTRGIRITVRPQYMAEQSSPEQDRYLFTYFITIANESNDTVQLRSRHWVITNGEGHTEEVQGPGVVGEQPTLQPGEVYEYNSFCPLNTAVGTMQGSFRMRTEDGDEFDARIEVFRLAVSQHLH